MQQNIIPMWDQLPALTWREKVAYLAHQWRDVTSVPCSLSHHFDLYGTYIREIQIPAGTLFLGRAHRHGHECTLVSGSVIHISSHGKREISAPFTMHTLPGYHMVLYAITDCIGRTVHPNASGTRDTEWLEADIFEPAADLMAFGASVAARLEYQQMLSRYRLQDQQFAQWVHNEADQIPFPSRVNVIVAESAIDGCGLIATHDIAAHERIAPARIAGKRTPAGRYTNHAAPPNAVFVKAGSSDIDLVALTPIRAREEITVDYRQAVRLARAIECQA